MNSMSSWLKNTGSGYFKEREARKMITEKEGRELMTTYFDEWGRAAKVAIQSRELEDWLYAAGCRASYDTMKIVLEVENG